MSQEDIFIYEGTERDKKKLKSKIEIFRKYVSLGYSGHTKVNVNFNYAQDTIVISPTTNYGEIESVGALHDSNVNILRASHERIRIELEGQNYNIHFYLTGKYINREKIKNLINSL